MKTAIHGFFLLIVIELTAILYESQSYDAFASSVSFSRQELTDPPNDWSIVRSNRNYSVLELPDGREIVAKLAQNTSECKSPNNLYPFPDIAGVSYFSNGTTLNATLWLSDLFKEPPENASAWVSPPFKTIPWYKTYYVMVIGIPSTYDTPGADYRIYLRWDVFNENWIKTIEEVSPNGKTRILSQNYNYSGFYDKRGSHVDFPLDLDSVSSPNKYWLFFYIANLFINEGRFCIISDISNSAYIPPPNFLVSTDPNSISLRPGEEKPVEIKVKSDSDINSVVSLSIENQSGDLQANFTSDKLSVAPYGLSSSQLKVKATDHSQPHLETMPVLANISISTEAKVQAKNVVGDKLNNTKDESIIENSNLTINILPPLTIPEQLNIFLTEWFNPITGAWITISTIATGVISWRIWKRKKAD